MPYCKVATASLPVGSQEIINFPPATHIWKALLYPQCGDAPSSSYRFIKGKTYLIFTHNEQIKFLDHLYQIINHILHKRFKDFNE